jgi:hypothetical protein
MENKQDSGGRVIPQPPRWMFLGIAIGGAWASGLYLGQITQAGASSDLILRVVFFGLLSLLMAWGALRRR